MTGAGGEEQRLTETFASEADAELALSVMIGDGNADEDGPYAAHVTKVRS